MATDDRLTLLLIRHAIADDRATFARTGRPDRERPLTAEGRRKMRSAAARLLWKLRPKQLRALGETRER